MLERVSLDTKLKKERVLVGRVERCLSIRLDSRERGLFLSGEADLREKVLFDRSRCMEMLMMPLHACARLRTLALARVHPSHEHQRHGRRVQTGTDSQTRCSSMLYSTQKASIGGAPKRRRTRLWHNLEAVMGSGLARKPEKAFGFYDVSRPPRTR